MPPGGGMGAGGCETVRRNLSLFHVMVCLHERKKNGKKRKVKRKDWEKKEVEHDLGGGDYWGWMLSETFVLKKFLPNQKKLCRWSRKCPQNKNCGFTRINRKRPSDLRIYLLLFILAFILKNNFIKENRKPFTAIKTPTKYKNLFPKNKNKKKIKTSFSCLRKKEAQESCIGGWEIPSCLWYGPRSFKLQNNDAQTEIIVLYQLLQFMLMPNNTVHIAT